MKTLLLLCVTVASTWCIIAPPERSYLHYGQNITELINHEGYPMQNITVETKDGYLLDIIRITGPRSNGAEITETRKNHQRSQSNKPVVLLMHGLLGSAEDFVVGGYSRGLAYKLADNGYDVFLGSARGSRYGRKHKHLNPERDSHFWNFCWYDIGMSDLPSIIDKILDVTGQEKLNYIGHNQGSTVFYVLASQKPKYNNKIDKMIALAPLVIMKHANHPLMSLINKNSNSPTWITKNLGRNEFSPSKTIKNEWGQQLDCNNLNQKICESNYFMVNGHSQHLNVTIAQQIADSHPEGASTKQLLHYAQLIKSGGFRMYDADDSSNESDSDDSSNDSDSSDGSNHEEYNLSKVTTDNYLFYVPDDMWYNEEDINSLARQLPNVVKKVKLSQYSSNVDLLIAENAHDHVHQHILQCLQDEISDNYMKDSPRRRKPLPW